MKRSDVKKLLVLLLFLLLVELPTLSFGETYNMQEYFPLESAGRFLVYRQTWTEFDETHIDAESEYADGKEVVNWVGCTRYFTRGGEEFECATWRKDGLRLYKWVSMSWPGHEIYKPYLLICPIQLETGTPFMSPPCRYKLYDDGTLDYEGPVRIELEALGEEVVTVPEGTYNCLKIHGKVEWLNEIEESWWHIWEADIWLAHGVGLVKMDLTNKTEEEEPIPILHQYESVFRHSPPCPHDGDDGCHRRDCGGR